MWWREIINRNWLNLWTFTSRLLTPDWQKRTNNTGCKHLLLSYKYKLQNLRAVCCKDQLRSCNIEKNDFPKLCQNKGLGELVLKIQVSGRLDFYIFFGNFFCILCSQRPKLTPKLGIFRRLPFKKWKRCGKDQPRKSKDLISSAYCRCKIWKGAKPEFVTNFLNLYLATELINSEFRRIQGSKKHSGTWLQPMRLYSGEEQSFQLQVGRKKNWGKLNGEFWLYFQNRSLSDPLTFDVNSEINTRLLLIWLSFVGIHVSLLLFALLAYS